MTERDDQADDRQRCASCARNLDSSEVVTCKACVGKVRADLHGIGNAHALLPAILASQLGSNAPRRRSGKSDDESPLPGGTALVMLAGGSDARSSHGDDLPGDPASVAWELGRAEDDWRRVRNLPGSEHPISVGPSLAFLLEHLDWAARKHPAFTDFAEDMRTLRHQLDRATGTHDTPLRAEAPCISCGGRLIRDYRPAVGAPDEHGRGRDTWGLVDDWTCSRCHRKYDSAAYMLACRQMIEARALTEETEETA